MFGARGKLVVNPIVHAFSEAKLVLFFVDNKTWPLTTSSSTNFSIHSLFPFYYISPEVLEETYTSSFLSFSSLFRAASLNTYRTIINNDVYSKNMTMRSVKKAVFWGTPWPGTWGTCPKAPYTTLCNIYYSAVKMIPQAGMMCLDRDQWQNDKTMMRLMCYVRRYWWLLLRPLLFCGENFEKCGHIWKKCDLEREMYGRAYFVCVLHYPTWKMLVSKMRVRKNASVQNASAQNV